MCRSSRSARLRRAPGAACRIDRRRARTSARRRAFHAARRLTERRSVEDDLLGFAPFAERLSKVITRQNAPNGYVIGLHGEWGSGKSTALNFVSAFLKKHNDATEAEKERIQI